MIEIVARIGDSIVEISDGPCRAHDGTPLVTPGTVTIGVVTYTIARTELSGRIAEPVPRPRIAKRPFAYLAASLVVQLAIWFVAASTAPFEKLERPVHRIVRVTHVRLPDPPPLPKPKPPKPTPDEPKPEKPTPAASSAVHHHPPRAPRRDEPDDPDENDEAADPSVPGDPAVAEAVAIAHLAKTFDDIDVAGQMAKTDGPLVDANTETPGAFGGGGHHFDVDAVAPEETYAVKRWALPTYIRTKKGQLAPVPTIEWCDEDSCLTRGSLPIGRVLAILGRHEKEIAQCYREHTGDLVGNVRVRFPVDAEGKVFGKLGTATGPVGYGTGTVGHCIAKIAQGIRWPQAHDDTYVFVGLAFRPASG